jgi:Protein of unknown function (DUF3365)
MKPTDHRQRVLLKSTLVAFVAFLVFSAMSCTQKKVGDETTAVKEPIPDSVYIKKGNEIVALTFDTLRNSLLHAISSKGAEGAITFCNENAYNITATYADSVLIRRSASRYRNPENKPDSLESFILDEMNQQVLSAGKPGTRIVRNTSGGEIHFFKPILLQPMCLNCHGAPGKEIAAATVSKIQELYPDDSAVDFKEGDLRGVWHIVFKSQQN